MGHFLGSTLLVTIHPWSYRSCPTPLAQASVDPTITRLSSSYWMCSSGPTVFIFLSTGWAEICICWVNKWKSPLRDMEWVSVSGPYALLKTVLAKHLWFNSYFSLTALHLLLQFRLLFLYCIFFLPFGGFPAPFLTPGGCLWYSSAQNSKSFGSHGWCAGKCLIIGSQHVVTTGMSDGIFICGKVNMKMKQWRQLSKFHLFLSVLGDVFFKIENSLTVEEYSFKFLH